MKVERRHGVCDIKNNIYNKKVKSRYSTECHGGVKRPRGARLGVPCPIVCSAVEAQLGLVFAHTTVRASIGPGVTGRETVGVFNCDRLCTKWARTRWPAASALIRDNSPAMTAEAMMRASCCAFLPGSVGCAPLTPSISSIAPCGARTVPPPIVPTSIQGIDTVIRRSLPLFVLEHKKLVGESKIHCEDTHGSINVIQFELSTF